MILLGCGTQSRCVWTKEEVLFKDLSMIKRTRAPIRLRAKHKNRAFEWVAPAGCDMELHQLLKGEQVRAAAPQ